MKPKTRSDKPKAPARVGSMRLLGCPHCGATPESTDKENGKGVYVYQNAPSSDMQTRPHVACLECGSGSPSVEVWNRRQPNTDISDRR